MSAKNQRPSRQRFQIKSPPVWIDFWQNSSLRLLGVRYRSRDELLLSVPEIVITHGLERAWMKRPLCRHNYPFPTHKRCTTARLLQWWSSLRTHSCFPCPRLHTISTLAARRLLGLCQLLPTMLTLATRCQQQYTFINTQNPASRFN